MKWAHFFLIGCLSEWVYASAIVNTGTGGGSGSATLPLPGGATNYIQASPAAAQSADINISGSVIVKSSSTFQPASVSTRAFSVNDLSGNAILRVDNTPVLATDTNFSVIGSTSAKYSLSVSTSSLAPFHLAISTAGHFNSQGPVPTMGTCGTNPSVVGSDNAGTITVGGGVVTACTLNFAQGWNSTPSCVMSDNSTTITGDISALSTSSITFSFSATLGGGLIYYQCTGRD